MKELFTYLPILLFLIIIYKLSNRELDRTLDITKASEEFLLKEKSKLEEQISVKSKKLKESRFQRMNELSRAAEFGRLNQGLFHDLMTPLSSIILHTEKLEKIPREDIEMINITLRKTADASQKMAQYIENIKTLIKDEQIKKECILYKEIKDIIGILGYRIRNEKVNINLNIPETYTLFEDQIKIRQVFLNIISNALDSYDGIDDNMNRRIDIKANLNNNKINVFIEDNGCGIKKENLDKIFEPFFSTKNNNRGIGIGLTTVKKIIEDDFSGKISVSSRENVGTSIRLELPYTIYRS